MGTHISVTSWPVELWEIFNQVAEDWTNYKLQNSDCHFRQCRATECFPVINNRANCLIGSIFSRTITAFSLTNAREISHVIQLAAFLLRSVYQETNNITDRIIFCLNKLKLFLTFFNIHLHKTSISYLNKHFVRVRQE